MNAADFRSMNSIGKRMIGDNISQDIEVERFLDESNGKVYQVDWEKKRFQVASSNSGDGSKFGDWIKFSE